MKLTEEQKWMIGFPTAVAIALAGLIIPIILADQGGHNPWWLLLWVPSALVTGVVFVAVSQWASRGK